MFTSGSCIDGALSTSIGLSSSMGRVYMIIRCGVYRVTICALTGKTEASILACLSSGEFADWTGEGILVTEGMVVVGSVCVW